MRAFCGIDWASDHHDIAIVDETGALLARARIDDTAEGLDRLLRMLAEHGDSPQDPVPVAIETSRGLLVACLRATGRPVYDINPMAAGTDTRSPARNPTTWTPWCWRTSSAPMPPLTACFPQTGRQQADLTPARVLPRLSGRSRPPP